VPVIDTGREHLGSDRPPDAHENGDLKQVKLRILRPLGLRITILRMRV